MSQISSASVYKHGAETQGLPNISPFSKFRISHQGLSFASKCIIFYRISTHFHSHSPQGSLSHSCIIFICFNICCIIRTLLKNGFDTHNCILSCHDTSGRHLLLPLILATSLASAAASSLYLYTSFVFCQLNFSLKRNLLQDLWDTAGVKIDAYFHLETRS